MIHRGNALDETELNVENVNDDGVRSDLSDWMLGIDWVQRGCAIVLTKKKSGFYAKVDSRKGGF